jgi:hypothetical protein
MPDIRLVMLNVLALAMAATMAHALARPDLHVVLSLSTIDWRDVKLALACPSDLPRDCVILWGP